VTEASCAQQSKDLLTFALFRYGKWKTYRYGHTPWSISNAEYVVCSYSSSVFHIQLNAM